MSEDVKITIIIENQNGIERREEVTHESGATLLSTLQKTNYISESFCGGNGKCGRCRVQFLEGAPLPGAVERSVFSPDELRKGFRLACMVRPKNSCVIRPAFVFSTKRNVVTDVITMSDKDDLVGQPQNKVLPYLIAVDLGTTTIAMQLRETESGKVVDSYCAMNPQRRYGADVLSRIQAANEGHAEEMQESVKEVIRQGVRQFLKTCGRAHEHNLQENIQQGQTSKHHSQENVQQGQTNKHDVQRFAQLIQGICIAGNTTMGHLFMGLSTKTLGESPFTPVEIGWQRTNLLVEYQPEVTDAQEATSVQESASVQELDSVQKSTSVPEAAITLSLPVLLVPGISTFVGGDIVAGLYYCGLLPQLESQKKQAALFLDLGTNGEMALTDGRQMLVTATAAGPAFEGGVSAAIPGSDMIALVSSLLEREMMDETGLLAEPYFSQGVEVCGERVSTLAESGQKFVLRQKDIRDLQMAKAAVRAGIECLWNKMGQPAITMIYLAGGFGYYLDTKAAVHIGLLPEQMIDTAQKTNSEQMAAEPKAKVQAVGNTALAGAYIIGRDVWSGRLKEEKLSDAILTIQSINLAREQAFEEIYLQSMNF